MKKIIFCGIFLLFFQHLPVYAEIMRFVYFENAPPYSWLKNKQMHGILIDIADED